MNYPKITPAQTWALVTGAGTGIGRAYALQLAAMGYNLILVGNQDANLHAVVRELTPLAQNQQFRPLVMDLARIDAAEELYEAIAAAGIEIDLLINNAGIFSFCDVMNTSEE
ncbi:MAG: SDR family NAD(P)-dependent oxidoreductase, partial [Alistipes sp.]|nr:SDR family NAD(P)-dependent oxidoreductase [Alistipes sp.]